eukprot:9488138-Pyramimonas_sp.AAC.1
MMLLEVDDFMIGSANEEARSWLRRLLESRFKFGKYRDCHAGSVDFAGRRVTFSDSKIVVDQEKYILEEVRPLSMAKGRMSDKSAPLGPDEFKALRSLVYKFNWVGRESRPEAAGIASILASRLKNATIYDVMCANKL